MTGRQFWPFAAARVRDAESRLDWDLRRVALQTAFSGMCSESAASLYQMWTGQPWSDEHAAREDAHTQGGMARRIMEKAAREQGLLTD